MKHPTKAQIEYTRLAMSLSGLPINDITAEHILIVQGELERLGGKFSLRDAAKIEAYLEARHNPKKVVTTTKRKP